MSYFVICREDTKPDGTPGDYTLSTRRWFETEEEALRHAQSCSPSRCAMVLKGIIMLHKPKNWIELKYKTPA